MTTERDEDETTTDPYCWACEEHVAMDGSEFLVTWQNDGAGRYARVYHVNCIPGDTEVAERHTPGSFVCEVTTPPGGRGRCAPADDSAQMSPPLGRHGANGRNMAAKGPGPTMSGAFAIPANLAG